MTDMRKLGYFTAWMYDTTDSTASHRIYYNDIDIATGDYLCDGNIVGNVRSVNRTMNKIDKMNGYNW